MDLEFVEALMAWVWIPTEIRGDAACEMGFFGNLDFLWFLCRVGVGFHVGASCVADVCRPFSVLICQQDGFLGVLLVGLFHCIVWVFWVSIVS